jgi:hypothetical protein
MRTIENNETRGKKCKELDTYSDEIVKTNAFVDYKSSMRWKKTIPSYKNVMCNDYELYKLKPLGTVSANYNVLVSLYGYPQIMERYNNTYRFQIVWYIKFSNGTISCIRQELKKMIESRYNEKWKISGTCDNSMKYLVLMLL